MIDFSITSDLMIATWCVIMVAFVMWLSRGNEY